MSRPLPLPRAQADLVRAWAGEAAGDASAIVRALAAADPNFRGHDPEHECSLCGVLGAVVPADHALRCTWRRAREWVAACDGPDVPEDIEPPMYDDGEGPEPWQRRAP